MKNKRINNLEIRRYKSTKTKEKLWEIIRWYNNSFFGKKQQYLDAGYKEDGIGSLLKGGMSVSMKLFENPESCYVVAFLEEDLKENDSKLRPVGSRILQLDEQELGDFMKLYKYGHKKIVKNL